MSTIEMNLTERVEEGNSLETGTKFRSSLQWKRHLER